MYVIYFDGICVFCHRSVHLLLKLDRKKRFYFASLQSAYAQTHLPPELSQTVESIVYQKNDQIHIKSCAVIRIVGDLGLFWAPVYLFLLVPSFIRNGLYQLFAQFRYKLFGTYDQCPVVEARFKSRFLD